MKLLIFILAAIGSSTAFAWTELPSLSSLKVTSDPKETLVIFDIDNTLLRSTTMVGSVEWAEYMKARYIENGLSPLEASEKQHSLFSNAQQFVTLTPVEGQLTIDTVNNLTARNYRVLALTARASQMQLLTELQIKKSGIVLSRLITPSGALFAGSQDKGVVLEQVISKLEPRPKRIIFIDDKDYNVIAVERAVKKMDLDGEMYWYTANKNVVNSFNPSVADLQWMFLRHTFSHAMPNEDALRWSQTSRQWPRAD